MIQWKGCEDVKWWESAVVKVFMAWAGEVIGTVVIKCWKPKTVK